jgi:iron complex outermembrane receptor protein
MKTAGYALAGLTTLFCVPVLCQTSPTSSNGPAASGVATQEVIVTARRVEEKLQETPVAVTAISANELTERSAFNIADVGRLAPNLQIRNAGGTQSEGFVFIRGIGQSSDNPELEPGVGVYVDDVYSPRNQNALFDLDDVANIEVLRGPQGTLYGKNTVGGAIKVSSHLPGPDPDFSASASYGNLN